MTIEMATQLFGWATVINLGMLTVWFLMFVLAHDWLYQLHGRWFRLSVERFDAIHYSGMAFYKIAIFLFNFTPFLALHLAT